MRPGPKRPRKLINPRNSASGFDGFNEAGAEKAPETLPRP